jgi:hypothetical protein
MEDFRVQTFEYFGVYLFVLAALMYIGLYVYNRWQYLKNLTGTSFHVSLIAMYGGFFLTVLEEKWFLASLLILACSLVSFREAQ